MTIFKWKFPPEDGYWNKILNYWNSVALDGNPEPDLVHATGCKQPSLTSCRRLNLIIPQRSGYCENFTLDHWTGHVNAFWSCFRELLPHYLADFLVAGCFCLPLHSTICLQPFVHYFILVFKCITYLSFATLKSHRYYPLTRLYSFL
jgi:hypothetical protein